MRILKASMLVAATAAGACSIAQAQTFESIADPTCINGAYMAPYATGEQYMEGYPQNGVLPDTWGMLVRWQGPNFVNNSVSYDVGQFTGLHNAWQRGVQPERSDGTAAVQLSCYDVGMLINTWTVPHRPIVGGGYNDMWGRSFNSTDVRPFVENGVGTDLVLQGNIAVPLFGATHNLHKSDGSEYVISGQLGFYAYLRDTTHPTYPPIVVLAMTHVSGTLDPTWMQHGGVGYDYGSQQNINASNEYPNWYPGGRTDAGIWYVAAPISTQNDQRYLTIHYTEATLETGMVPHYDLNTSMPFWRAHISPTNVTNIVNDINAKACTSGDCPARPAGGYSTTPGDWRLEYAGVIAENALVSEDTSWNDVSRYDTDPNNWVGFITTPMYSDYGKDQVSMGVHLYGVGIYRYLP